MATIVFKRNPSHFTCSTSARKTFIFQWLLHFVAGARLHALAKLLAAASKCLIDENQRNLRKLLRRS